jgi:uncharacterized membrane protein
MALLPNRISARNAFSLVALISVLLVPVLLILLPPDGTQRAAWAQFIGRFHPLAVHLPIALIVLVPILELIGKKQKFSHLRQAVPFVLTLALAGAVVAAFLGWCLGRNGGFTGPLVTQHMWSAAALLGLCWTCWLARIDGSRLRGMYPIALGVTVAAVAFTGYRGGQLSFGENHLTEFIPAVFGGNIDTSDQGANDPSTFYGARIQPIFSAQCLTCHSAAKRKGGLQLTSYAALMRGGKHGAVVKAGDASGSDLLHRVTLPPSDDSFMPKGKPALSADQAKLIELWIAAGASGTASVESINGASASPSSQPVLEVKFPEIDKAAVAKQRAAIASTVAQLQQRFPNVLDYESRDSAYLVVNSSIMAEHFGDGELEACAPLASHIAIADFSRTAITDKSAAILGSMKSLRELRLMHTTIGDPTVEAVAGLDRLESVSVFDTRVTPVVLPKVESMPHLKHFYVAQTGISAASISPALKDKVVF